MIWEFLDLRLWLINNRAISFITQITKTHFSSDSKLCTRRSWTSSSSLIPAGDNFEPELVFSELKVDRTRKEAGRRQGWICKVNQSLRSWPVHLWSWNLEQTSSNSPSALTTVSVFLLLRSSKCGGEYPGNALLVWLSSLVKGLTSTSGDSSSPLRSSIVLVSSKSRSWDDTSLDRWALSSTERRVMEDL